VFALQYLNLWPLLFLAGTFRGGSVFEDLGAVDLAEVFEAFVLRWVLLALVGFSASALRLRGILLNEKIVLREFRSRETRLYDSEGDIRG